MEQNCSRQRHYLDLDLPCIGTFLVGGSIMGGGSNSCSSSFFGGGQKRGYKKLGIVGVFKDFLDNKKSFLKPSAEGRSPPQELEVGPFSRLRWDA